jgi:hypothetical protein
VNRAIKQEDRAFSACNSQAGNALAHLIHGIVEKCQNIMPSQYVMQSQVVANFATSVVSDSLTPLNFMLTGEEARIRQASTRHPRRLPRRKNFRDETMNCGAVFAGRVAARMALCHKSPRFSAAHNIWRLDDCRTPSYCVLRLQGIRLLADGVSQSPGTVLMAALCPRGYP